MIAAAALLSSLRRAARNDANEVEHAIAAFARDPNGGLIVTASGFGANNPELMQHLRSGTICPRSTRSAIPLAPVA